MAVRPIVFLGEPVLREKAQKVRQMDKPIDKLIDDMVATLRSANGYGLAANQVGVRQRVIVIELPVDKEDPQSGKLYTLVNPEITSSGQELVAQEEGCLSIPYYYGEVIRPSMVVVKARDRKWHEVKIKANGLLARVLQHEIDHLSGVLFVDRMEDIETLRYVPAHTEQEVESGAVPKAKRGSKSDTDEQATDTDALAAPASSVAVA